LAPRTAAIRAEEADMPACTSFVRSIPGALWLSFTLVVGCSSAPPAAEPPADAPVAAARGEHGAPEDVGNAALIGPRFCNSSLCNAGCGQQPGVSGGSCVGGACVCAAPTCGAFDQPPCAGNYCSQGHYDAWLNLCDGCGANGATCCDYLHPGATPSCASGLFCQDGYVCGKCGDAGEAACRPAGGDPYCNSGFLAVSGTSYMCVAQCGSNNELPCANGGCTDPTTILTGGTCQLDPSCGWFQGPCCAGGTCRSRFDCMDANGIPGLAGHWCYI
jgi:hypothetical protein